MITLSISSDIVLKTEDPSYFWQIHVFQVSAANILALFCYKFRFSIIFTCLSENNSGQSYAQINSYIFYLCSFTQLLFVLWVITCNIYNYFDKAVIHTNSHMYVRIYIYILIENY